MDCHKPVSRLSIKHPSRCTARWPQRHADLPDNYRSSPKRNIFTCEIYPTTCIEWAGDQFGFGMTCIDLLSTKICAKTILHFRSQWPWPLTFRPQVCFHSYRSPALWFHLIRNFFGFPISRKLEARGGRTDGRTDGMHWWDTSYGSQR